MDKSAVEAIVDQNIELMRWALQLQDWTLIVGYEAVEGYAASSKVDPDYCTVMITIDPAKHEDRAAVLTSLRHEMIHVLAGPFILYENAVSKAVTPEEWAVLLAIFTHALERQCAAIEGLLDHGLRLGTDDMLRRARRHVKDWRP